MKPSVLFALSVLLVAGCKSPASRVNQLHTGMTKPQVIELLGEPRSTVAQDNLEILHYRLLRYRPPIKVPVHEDYDVCLSLGTVFAFGSPRDLRGLNPPHNEKTVNVNISATNTAPIVPTVTIPAH